MKFSTGLLVLLVPSVAESRQLKGKFGDKDARKGLFGDKDVSSISIRFVIMLMN